MGTINKQLIKNINNGKNLDKDLPIYFNTLAGQYKSQALIRCAMQYYVMYEQYIDGIFVEKEVHDTVKFIGNMMNEIFIKKDSCQVEECITKIEAERINVIRKMEVLTNYTDQLLVYEYVLNRIEHKFDDKHFNEDVALFTQKLMQYILGVKDNFVINEKIKDVISQLPVRMARSKFYELVKNSITLYKGAQKESLNSYLYMLRTSAMLYKPEAEGQYFSDWGLFVEKLKTIDFDALDKENFKELLEELQEKAISIRYTSEMFVALQELINSLYVFALMEQDENVVLDVRIQEKLRICEEIIAKIDAQMYDDECEILPMVLEERLCQLEGVPEEIAMNLQQLEGCMALIKETFRKELDDNGLVTIFENMEKAQTLLSDSLFVEFKEEALEEVTEQMAEQETEKLVDEFAQLFQGKSIKVVRAVIASTIARMPVFFANTEEVAEYIQSSLEQCKDHAEKQASYEILTKMMEEEN